MDQQQSYTRISDLPTSDNNANMNYNNTNQIQSANQMQSDVFPPTVSISKTKGNKIDGDTPTHYIPINVHQNPYGISEQNPIMDHGAQTQNIPPNFKEEITNMKQQRLPSRDIHQDTTIYSNDEQIQPNYIPKSHIKTDYVRESEDMTEYNLQEFNRKKKRLNTLDTILTELQTPLFITLLFFIFQLPIVNNILKQFSILSLHNLDGNFNLTGLILKSIIFGIFYYISYSTITIISEI